LNQMTQNSAANSIGVALITGASSGFGKLTSELLSENGFRVFGESRSKEFERCAKKRRDA
jgi:NADP-dependent 3-hydroxy acid dehydrogenase YdfG